MLDVARGLLANLVKWIFVSRNARREYADFETGLRDNDCCLLLVNYGANMKLTQLFENSAERFELVRDYYGSAKLLRC